MARATRIALDFALVSIERVCPVISKLWLTAKSKATNTSVKPLVDNTVVSKLEGTISSFTAMLVTKMVDLRNRQLPLEKEYLEKELARVNEKLGQKAQSHSTSMESKPTQRECGRSGDVGSKTLQYHGAIAWQYLRVESVPPMTMSYFNGPSGDKLTQTVSGAISKFISGIENKIKEMDAEEERVKREKEAAILAAQEAIKAEELKKKKEAIAKATAAKIAKEQEAKKKADDEKLKAEAKKKDEKPTSKPAKKK